MKNIPVFVIHVHGNQERKEHIERELHKKNLSFEFIKSGRGAGSYVVDFEFASSFMRFVEKEKCHLPIDHMHNRASSKSVIDIYWAHPGITEQKSYNGDFDSLIDLKVKKSLRRKINHLYKKYIKVKLYSLFQIEK